MSYIQEISSLYWINVILISATGFTILWFLDALTHKRLVAIDITDKELQTHRNILLSSFLMELSLIGMYWFDVEMLPFFIAFFITRTAHEFIDELYFHADRCSVYESRLHLGMWSFVLIKTSAMFMWGFFSNYKGFEDLPIIYFIWVGIVVIAMGLVGLSEWRR